MEEVKPSTPSLPSYLTAQHFAEKKQVIGKGGVIRPDKRNKAKYF
jgi:hypothetical protein